MSDLVKDIGSIELETLNNIKSSKSLNTVRAYKSDFNHFSNFCKKIGLIHYLLILKLFHFILLTSRQIQK